MLFNEKEMLNICKKYGIDVVEKEGYPLYDGDEMDESFSMDDIMNDTYNITMSTKIIYSNTIELELPITFENSDFTNFFLNAVDKPSFISMDIGEYYYIKAPSSISNNSNVSIAA